MRLATDVVPALAVVLRALLAGRGLVVAATEVVFAALLAA